MAGIIRNLLSKRRTFHQQILKLDKHFFKTYSPGLELFNMNEMLLRYNEGSDRFQVIMRYCNDNLKVDKLFNFDRSVNETISVFTRRVQISISEQTNKKVRRKLKKEPLEQQLAVHNHMKTYLDKGIKFVKGNETVSGDLMCKYILENVADVKLIVFDTEYKLRQNVPRVLKMRLSTNILHGFPTYPSCFETEYVSMDKCTFEWHRLSNENRRQCIQTEMIGEGIVYTPTESDIGKKLVITCIPRNDTQVGPAITIVSNNTVEDGPGFCPFETRHAFTNTKLSGKSFRVTCYNILAHTYSVTELSKDVLYTYCPHYALSMDYRKLLILKELKGYNADIMCLQEVETSVYKNDLTPALNALEYNSIYNLKNDLCEGLAIFYRKERFAELSCNYSVLSQDTDLDEFKTVWSQISNEVKQTFLNRSTIVQALALRSKENPEILVVGNIHLYFRPDASYIRLLQAYYGLMYLQKYAKEIQEQYPEFNVSILYCGDFNSTPTTGVYRLITQKYVPKDHPDWKSCPDEHIENVSLTHDLNLVSACGTPEYTNYTKGYAECLDYIFYQKDYLNVEQVVPMPSKEELSAHTALPSVVFPSDHISLCTDLKWLK